MVIGWLLRELLKKENWKPKLVSSKTGQGFGSGIRNKIISFYQKVLPQPMSGLIAGITLVVKVL